MLWIQAWGQSLKYKPLTLGPLPLGPLTQFGLQLDEGLVHFTIPAQRHAAERHPEEYPLCFPHLLDTVQKPTHVGQAPKHAEAGFELVRQVSAGSLIVLVAVLIKPTKSGIHLVKSVYPIDAGKLENRVRRGYLIEV